MALRRGVSMVFLGKKFREGEWALVRPRLDADQLIGLDRLPPWL
jgi:hypothetical protein